MDNIFSIMSWEERAAFTLCSLYRDFGFEKYRMSKFEEYDLYVKNKDFLVSENVITFTDTDGKLLALKPDVTLSIIKNAKVPKEGLMKVYYKENVYRVAKGTRNFKELMQAGVECLGDVTLDTVIELLTLAAKSLDTISQSNLLEISSLDIVSGVLNALSVSERAKAEIFRFLGEKNADGVRAVALSEGLSEDDAALIGKLVSVYGEPSVVLPELSSFGINEECRGAIEALRAIVAGLSSRGVSRRIIIDFSVVNDMNYYNGIAFKGFIEGIPVGILSGGEYDSLMRKMNKHTKGIGFAVYLDELSRLKGTRGACEK